MGKITDITQVKIGGQNIVTPEVEKDILQMWNKQLFSSGVIPEELYEKAITEIERL